ncbi:hypothetical protein ACFVFQ_36045 [Streptomyces sp. NPDC057743]|uniref:hypothetical protein n=1 Tax=Streptomyces sp. NPDC057743 TaxID=3346236 RepID=UPI0036CAC6DD
MTFAKYKVPAALALAGIGLVGMAQTATANDLTVYTHDNSGHAKWFEAKHEIGVCDDKADGWGTRGYIYRPKHGDPGNGTVLLKVNDPSAKGHCGWGRLPQSPAGHLNIKVCSYKGAKIEDCTWAPIR